jgi:quercetin dioxygenase-like cupin family protein
MIHSFSKSAFVRRLTIAGTAAAIVLTSTAAMAAECPAGQMGVDVQKPGATAVKNATDKVLGFIDLGQEKVALKGHKFRFRRLDIKPGGEIAWHSHEDRPALIYVLQGEITEYSSTCKVPLVHKAGDLSIEDHPVKHWWKNTGKKTVVLLAADIMNDGMTDEMTQ